MNALPSVHRCQLPNEEQETESGATWVCDLCGRVWSNAATPSSDQTVPPEPEGGAREVKPHWVPLGR
jgi:hypothetical protein